MKTMYTRLFSILLAAALLFAFAHEALLVPVSALDIEIGSDIHTQGLNELNVRQAVNQYFAQRKDFLKGNSDTIEIAVEPMVVDEEKHINTFDANGIVLIDSAVAVGEISYNTNQASAVAVETAVFEIDGEQITEIIEHDLHLYLDRSDKIWVNSDGYIENISEFVSCAYVNPEMVYEVNAGGSKYCIVEVARTQIGEGEDSSGVTKYGIWYSSVMGSGHNADHWCAIFVNWCAYYANISTSVINRTNRVTEMQTHFDNRGQYYYSKAYNSSTTFTPRAGDLIFMNDTPDSPAHIGIVTSCSGNTVYYIDGNSSVNGGDVRSTSASLTDPVVVGYARPSYSSSNHEYSDEWEWNSSHHWKECTHCEIATISKATHTIIQDATGREMCSVCLYGHSVIMKKDLEETE